MGGAEEINADGSGSETVVSRMESTVKLIKMSANSETITSSKTAIETLVSSSDSSTESSGSITSTVLTSQITLLKEAADASFEVKTLIKFSLLIIEMINNEYGNHHCLSSIFHRIFFRCHKASGVYRNHHKILHKSCIHQILGHKLRKIGLKCSGHIKRKLCFLEDHHHK